PLVEREAAALPVAGGAHHLHLLDDAVAVLLLPGPDAAEELLAAEIVAALALGLAEIPLHDHLRGDAGVIGPRQPERVESAHPLPAREHVLQGHEDRVAHVQLTGDVRRRDDDAERRLLALVLGAEEPPLLPE